MHEMFQHAFFIQVVQGRLWIEYFDMLVYWLFIVALCLLDDSWHRGFVVDILWWIQAAQGVQWDGGVSNSFYWHRYADWNSISHSLHRCICSHCTGFTVSFEVKSHLAAAIGAVMSTELGTASFTRCWHRSKLEAKAVLPNVNRTRKGPKNAVFCTLWLWPLTFTFRLVRVRDQVSYLWIYCKSVKQFRRHFIHKQKETDWQNQKQNLLQFTACGNKLNVKKEIK